MNIQSSNGDTADVSWMCVLPTNKRDYFLIISCRHAPVQGTRVDKEEAAPRRRREKRQRESEIPIAAPTTLGATMPYGDEWLGRVASSLRISELHVEEPCAEPAGSGSNTATSKWINKKVVANANDDDDVELEEGCPQPHMIPKLQCTAADDTLEFTLVQTSVSAVDGPPVWCTRAPIATRSLAPAGMDEAVYCTLLDELLRRRSARESGSVLEVALEAADHKGTPQAMLAATIQRVELRLSLEAHGPARLVVAFLELYPVSHQQAAGRNPLGSALMNVSSQLHERNELALACAAQAAEMARLRRQLELLLTKKLHEDEEQLLISVAHIINAKKERIRELTRALQQQPRRPKGQEARCESSDASSGASTPSQVELSASREDLVGVRAGETVGAVQHNSDDLGRDENTHDELPTNSSGVTEVANTREGGAAHEWLDDIFGM